MLRRLLFAFLFLALALPLPAQRDENAMPEGEIEQLRESAYFPSDRILAFIKLLDARNKRIQNPFAHPRKHPLNHDTHDLHDHFTATADSLNYNHDNYDPHHNN